MDHTATALQQETNDLLRAMFAQQCKTNELLRALLHQMQSPLKPSFRDKLPGSLGVSDVFNMNNLS